MRVFVTGATGFIGQHLVHRLVTEGHSVVALVRNPALASRDESSAICATKLDVTGSRSTR